MSLDRHAHCTIAGRSAAKARPHARSIPLNFRIDEELTVNKAIRTLAAGMILTGFGVALTGCTDESSSKTQTEVKTPGGTATITEKTTVSKSGNNPPPVNEPLKNP